METKDLQIVENNIQNRQTTCLADEQTSCSKPKVGIENDTKEMKWGQTENGDGTDSESLQVIYDLVDDMVTTENANSSNVSKQQSTKQTLSSSSGGLGLLAQYESDIETDSNDGDSNSVVELPIASETTNYRKQAIENVTDSDSDSDLSNDSNRDVEYLSTLRKEIVKTMEAVDDDDEDEDCGDDTKPRRRLPPKVKGEMLLDDLPPIEELQITVPEEECIELGRIHSIVDQLVLVSALPNSMLFDLETILFLEKGHKVLGEVFDVLGQVADPLYCVRFNSNQQIKDRNINVGDVVYCAPKTEHTQFVILSKLMQLRGSDASWENDIEPPPRYLDYSDDEEERDARAQWRNRDRPNEHNELKKRTRTDTICEDRASTSANTRHRHRDRKVTTDSNINNANRNRTREQYNYHPSYNSGSWHSNYYHNYHPTVDNYSMPPPPHVMHPAYTMPYSYPPPYAMPGYNMRPPIPPIYPQMYPQQPVGPLPPPPPPS